MTNIVLLNNVDHQDLTVATGHGPEFGDAVNQVLVFPTEWQDLQREYPILFRRSEDGRFQSVALVGLDRDENLFLGDGVWHARYIPALHQRGPFSIGLTRNDDGSQGEPMIHIDLDSSRIVPRATGVRGSPVFLPHGGNSPYLDAVSDVLGRIHDGVIVNDAMFDAFQAEGLIEPVSLEIFLDETNKYTLDDLYTISAERLAALDSAALARLHGPGFLQLAVFAIASVGTVSSLIERKTSRLAAQ
ncbi:hypothetical protein HMP09_1599 [Sphingomonas sp. HMP9]|uniref:SapC family protein n=1 Tax=Sphingomonas sp. HMP9 TaxID=1517554 RepID=UPI0015972B84|nr:SapC family protein [Sphingomonas sp. HMP9]BCA62365.1 hypothetical protein HMP09_1599 [Sphingomonas sp. HMP9]